MERFPSPPAALRGAALAAACLAAAAAAPARALAAPGRAVTPAAGRFRRAALHPPTLAAFRSAGLDLSRPRVREALAALLPAPPGPGGAGELSAAEVSRALAASWGRARGPLARALAAAAPRSRELAAAGGSLVLWRTAAGGLDEEAARELGERVSEAAAAAAEWERRGRSVERIVAETVAAWTAASADAVKGRAAALWESGLKPAGEGDGGAEGSAGPVPGPGSAVRRPSAWEFWSGRFSLGLDFSLSALRSLASRLLRPGAPWTRAQAQYEDSLEELLAAGRGAYGPRWEAGEDQALALEGLGWRAVRDRSGRVALVPPFRLETLWRRYEARLRERLARGEISEEDAIRPALVFVRRDGGGGHRFVRPGLDAWPDGEWRLLEKKGAGGSPAEAGNFLPESVFLEALGQGFLPMSLHVADHELGHLGEFFAHPRLMAAVRRRAAARDPARPPSPGERARGLILTEWLSLADPRGHSLAARLFPDWFGRHALRDLGEGTRLLLARSPREREALVRALSASVDSLFLRHGGAVRDARILRAQYPEARLLERAAGALAAGRFPLSRLSEDGNPHDQIVMELPHAWIRELEFMADLRRSPSALDRRTTSLLVPLSMTEAGRAVAAMEPAAREAALDRLIAERLALVATALAAGAELSEEAARRGRTSAEQVHEDCRDGPPAPGSPTARYASRLYASPGWLQHHLAWLAGS